MAQFDVEDLTPTFGSEIRGLRPEDGLDEEARQTLRAAFDARGLLLFRDVQLSYEFQVLVTNVVIGVDHPGPMDPYYVSNKEEGGGAPFGRLPFHSDMMWVENPVQALSLYAVEVNPPTSETMFVSATHAWETLPGDLRARVAGLRAVHGNQSGYALRDDGGEGEVLVSTFEKAETIEKPVGLRHPRTGRTILHVTPMMTQRIAGLPDDESEELLSELFAHLYRPDGIVHHDWRRHDLVLWDNLATQHARGDVKIDAGERTLRKAFAPLPSMRGPARRPTFTKAAVS